MHRFCAKGPAPGCGEVLRTAGATCLLILTIALGTPAQATTADIDFDWSVPPRYGLDLDEDGLIDAPTSRSEVDPPHWPVRLHLSPSACDHRPEEIRWTVSGRELPTVRDEDERCVFEAELPDEGRYDVELTVGRGDGAHSATRTVIIRDILIASVGDSVASGEGVPEQRVGGRRGKPRWQDDRCHRSALAGTAQAAAMLERADERSSVTFVHLACSGATVLNGVIGPYEGVAPDRRQGELPAQLSELHELVGQRPIDALLVSVGANDIHFSSIVKQCLATPRCPTSRVGPRGLVGRGRRPTLQEKVEHDLAELPKRYDQLADDLHRRYPGVPVEIVEYFDPTRGPDGQYCPRATGRMTRAELAWADRAVLRPLNQALDTAAHQHGWTVIGGVPAAFWRNGYCAAAGSRYIRTIMESLRYQHARVPYRAAMAAGAFHPNEAGHQATGTLIVAALQPRVLHGPPVAPPPSGDRGGGQGIATTPAPAPDPERKPTDTRNVATRTSNDDHGWQWWVSLGTLASVTIGVLGAALMAWRRRRRGASPLSTEPFVGRHTTAIITGSGAGLVAAGAGLHDSPALAAVIAAPGALAVAFAPLHSRLRSFRAGLDGVEAHFEQVVAAGVEMGLDPVAARAAPSCSNEPPTAVAAKLADRHQRLLLTAVEWLASHGYRIEHANVRHGFDAVATGPEGRFGVEPVIARDREQLRERIAEIMGFDAEVDRPLLIFDASIRHRMTLHVPWGVPALFVDGEDRFVVDVRGLDLPPQHGRRDYS